MASESKLLEPATLRRLEVLGETIHEAQLSLLRATRRLLANDDGIRATQHLKACEDKLEASLRSLRDVLGES